MAKNLDYYAPGSECYDNQNSNCDKYGRLYNWAAAKTACPGGWHLPSREEWNSCGRYAMCLKAASGWGNNGNGLDAYGFAALPGGSGYSGGDFLTVGYGGYWWSASEVSSSIAYYRSMIYYNEYALWSYLDKYNLFSVRCAQD
jgi:uncharacterized protein (TIGR02145 family)